MRRISGFSYIQYPAGYAIGLVGDLSDTRKRVNDAYCAFLGRYFFSENWLAGENWKKAFMSYLYGTEIGTFILHN
jgi:hypothetical protein